MKKISHELENANSIDEIVRIINGYRDYPENYQEGSKLAGQFVYSAAKDAGYGFDEGNLEGHLEILSDAGAVFEYRVALDEAKRLATD